MQISTFVEIFVSTYYVNYENQKKKVYYDEKKKKSKFKNVMIDVFFNDNNEFKYDLSFYICKHYFTFHLFDNFEKFRDHDIEYHDYDIRFAKFKHRLQNEKYIRYARENVYNYSSKSSYDYVIVQISIFD